MTDKYLPLIVYALCATGLALLVIAICMTVDLWIKLLTA
jgi:hypothetical protein